MDLVCAADSLAIEKTGEGGFNSGRYRATGCDRSGEYVAECNLFACVSRTPDELAAQEAERQAAAEARREEMARREAAAEQSGGGGGAPASSGPVRVSTRLTNLCSQTVRLFHGKKPGYSSGRTDSIGGNGIVNVSGNEGDTLWIVDERGDGMSSFSHNRNIKEIFITKSCTGFSTSR